MAKQRTEDQTFEDLLALDQEPFLKIKREFEYRLNKLYTHPLLGEMLDNGEIDYAVLDAVEEFGKLKDKHLAIHSDYARQEFMKYNIIKALLDQNILFKSKYYDELTLEHPMYYKVMHQYAKDKLDSMNPYEHFRYQLFKKVKGLKMGSVSSGVPYVAAIHVRNDLYPKKSYAWGDVGELYYKLPKMEEATEESFV